MQQYNKHVSAKPSHYDKEAEFYDQFNEHGSSLINRYIETTLHKHKAKTVLDFACGTGSQVFYLIKNGYHVTGLDISRKMLSIAQNKAKKAHLEVPLILGDMRTKQAGTFDAVITIHSAIGHLTKNDFDKSLKNIYKNLNTKGLYIFDIFNLDYLQEGENITHLTIDGQKKNRRYYPSRNSV